MSADIYFGIDVDTGGEAPVHVELWQGNVTYNLSGMWHDVGFDFHDIDGLEAISQRERVVTALKLLRADPEKYKAMNPANGWGNYEGLIEFFEDMHAAIEAHPKAKIRTWL